MDQGPHKLKGCRWLRWRSLSSHLSHEIRAMIEDLSPVQGRTPGKTTFHLLGGLLVPSGGRDTTDGRRGGIRHSRPEIQRNGRRSSDLRWTVCQLKSARLWMGVALTNDGTTSLPSDTMVGSSFTFTAGSLSRSFPFPFSFVGRPRPRLAGGAESGGESSACAVVARDMMASSESKGKESGSYSGGSCDDEAAPSGAAIGSDKGPAAERLRAEARWDLFRSPLLTCNRGCAREARRERAKVRDGIENVRVPDEYTQHTYGKWAKDAPLVQSGPFPPSPVHVGRDGQTSSRDDAREMVRIGRPRVRGGQIRVRDRGFFVVFPRKTCLLDGT